MKAKFINALNDKSARKSKILATSNRNTRYKTNASVPTSIKPSNKHFNKPKLSYNAPGRSTVHRIDVSLKQHLLRKSIFTKNIRPVKRRYNAVRE